MYEVMTLVRVCRKSLSSMIANHSMYYILEQLKTVEQWADNDSRTVEQLKTL